MVPRGAPQPISRRIFACLTLGVLAFTLYGSFVPFNWRTRPLDQATTTFEWLMKERFWPESRSDFVANFLLGLPLGFSLLAWIRFDAPNRIGTAIWGACLLPVCAAFAALVEFGQLYFPGRTCAGSDVVAQVAGASVGILIWVAFSQTLLEQLRRALTHPHVGSGAVRIFAGYFLLLALVQWLPLDLSASPSDLLRRFRDGHVTWEPLGELAGKPGEPPPNLWKKGEAWAELICLTLPLGLLLSTLPGRWESGEAWPAALGLSLAAGAILEGGQLFVQSRHPSTTDVLLTGLSAWSGWGLGLVLQRRSIRRQRRLWAFPLAGFWLTLLTIQAWQPFEFDSQILDTNWSRVGWFPLAGQAEKNYLWALNELLAKIVVYFPLGALVAWAWLQRWPKVAIGGSSLICGIAALILEVGQFAMPTRFSSPTDSLLAVVGGGVGAAWFRQVAESSGLTATSRVNSDSRGTRVR